MADDGNLIGTALTIVLAIGGIIGLFTDLFGFRSFITNKPLYRKIVLYILNKEVRVRLIATKRYPIKDIDFTHLINSIQPTISQILGNNLSPARIGTNYYEFVTEKMSAPILVSYYPETLDDEDIDSENTGSINIQCKILGNLVFTYRNVESYENTLRIIDDIYDVIEELHGIRSVYANYSVQVTYFDDFNEDWSTRLKVVNGQDNIFIGKKIAMIDAKRSSSIHDLKKYIILIKKST